MVVDDSRSRDSSKEFKENKKSTYIVWLYMVAYWRDKIADHNFNKQLHIHLDKLFLDHEGIREWCDHPLVKLSFPS
jgi:hypothetical protein